MIDGARAGVLRQASQLIMEPLQSNAEIFTVLVDPEVVVPTHLAQFVQEMHWGWASPGAARRASARSAAARQGPFMASEAARGE